MNLGPLYPLAAFRQFIPVMLVPLPNGKTDKIPVSAAGHAIDAHAPSNWMTSIEAQAAADRLAQMSGMRHGVGFVLTANDPFFCVDIDDCATPTGWSPVANQIGSMLPGTVAELSQSGRGLHLWGMRSKMPAHSMKNTELHLELYHDRRFLLLGTDAIGQMSPDCVAIDAVAAGYFPPRDHTGLVHGNGPRPDWRGPADDGELLRRALQSTSAKAAFSGKATFADLFNCNVEALARTYPTSGDSPYDASSADAALAQHLAFWTGCDHARSERIMRMSALVRPKYDREDYLPRTVYAACSMQREVLQDAPAAPSPTAVAVAAAAASAPSGALAGPLLADQGVTQPTIAAVEGRTFLGAQDQQALFAGCVYVLDAHKVLIPGGRMLTPDRFRAFFGGRTFIMDDRNERTSRNAFEVFTESQLISTPRADSTCFRPDLPPGTLVTTGGYVRANTYWPSAGTRMKGDPTPFIRHMRKLVPNERDLRALLSVLARWVQTPGHKSPFCVVLQGTEGNGKSFVSKAVAHCIGARYTHWPKASKIAAQFNGWLKDKLLICVEDIFVGPDQDVLEELKPMISGGAALEIEAKGVDQVSTEICCNLIINTNHKNGIRKTQNDRRFMVLWTAQQCAADLIRDGMDGEYMSGLHHWADHEGGWAIIHEYLATYPIDPEFDSLGSCQRAPVLSMTAEVIADGAGRIEQEINEAISQDTVGFMGGWISSIQLDHLLEHLKLQGRMPRSRRREMLEGMGYKMHPGLKNGRTDNPTAPDAGKPVLFVHASRVDLLSLVGAANIARAYREAQSPK